MFQSINQGSGVHLARLAETSAGALSLHRAAVFDDGRPGYLVLVFETGLGSALPTGADHGCDPQTLEARAYAITRHFQPLLVNTVVGFIGSEYLYNGRQILRARWEDHFCSVLPGQPMSGEACFTNHA